MSELFWPTTLGFGDADVGPALVLAGAAFLFVVYAYPLSARAWAIRLRAAGASAGTLAVLLERVGGALVLGLGAAGLWLAATGSGPHWASLARPAGTLAWTAAALGVVLPVVLHSARTERMQALYPEIRAARWDRRTALASLAATALYLFGYEAFFRGLLTFALVDQLGTWPGLSAMTALYVLAHLRKDARETLACLPMGYVFGVMALQTGSIWAPWLVHVALAWTTEWVTARRNPEMEYPL